jgi:hypothetical protein
MAERWQQWMPFHIDKFRGSPEVQAMHPAGRMGYLYLLASAWQTDDCTISAEPMDLATESGLGDELWALYGPRILRKFHAVDGGRLRNDVVFEEWSETKRVWEEKQMTPEERAELAIKRRAAGIAGNEKRWSMHRKMKQVATEGLQNIAICDEPDGNGIAKDRLTGTGTETTTEPQKQKPSRPPKADRVVDPRHAEFRENFRGYFLHKNPGLGEEPWDAQEASQLSRFLKKNPTFTTEQWRTLLWNRARSNVSHGENLSTWIARALTWASTPTQNTGGFTNAKPTVADNIAAKQGAIHARAARRMALESDHGGRALEAGGASAGPDGAGHPPGSLFRVS